MWCPGQLERFVDADVASELRGCFAGLWSLDDITDNETQKVIKQAIASPGDFILKPQREGGGNNLYGAGRHVDYQKSIAVQLCVVDLGFERHKACYIASSNEQR